jgi:hypothetical protein
VDPKVKVHITNLNPDHPLTVPLGVVSTKPHLYWLLGTVSFALFVKWIVHKTKAPEFTPGHETESSKKKRVEKMKVALTRIAEFEAWAKAQKKSGVYDEKKLQDALDLAQAVKHEIMDNDSVDVVVDNGRKRFPLIWNIGAGIGVNLFDFLFLLPLMPIGVGQWAFRKAEDTLFPPRLWNSETSLALLGEQVQDTHVLLPAAVQPYWWQRQNYYRQRSHRMCKHSGQHITDPYQRVYFFTSDTDAHHDHDQGHGNNDKHAGKAAAAH